MARTREVTQIDVHVGMRLKRRRLLVGMSQEEVGKALGVTFQQIQKYEKCTNRISAGHLFILAHILGMPVSEFFEGIPEHSIGTENSVESHTGMDKDLKRVEEFIQSREGLKLNLAYLGAKNPRVRKCVLELLASAQASPTD